MQFVPRLYGFGKSVHTPVFYSFLICAVWKRLQTLTEEYG